MKSITGGNSYEPQNYLCLWQRCCVWRNSPPAAAAEVDCDSTYCFSAGDFSGEAGLAGICITSLPDSETGTVLLGSRVLRPGDILTAGQLEQMTFRPVQTEYAREAVMTYLPIYSDRVEAAATMSIAVIGKQNQAPVAEDSTLKPTKISPTKPC